MSEEMPPIRVRVVDFEPLVSEALTTALGTVPGLEASTEGGDVLVVSSRHGAERLVETVRAASPAEGDRWVVVVGAEDDDEELLLEALAAGVTGYVTRSATVADLVEALRAVHRGETSVPARMLGGLLAGVARRRRDHERVDRLLDLLTPRELEVLQLLATGATNQQIADALNISAQTAKTHVQKVMKKLGVHSRLQAVVLATDGGLLEREGQR
jgi:DNA-binding NarL/FixJ family response regulator